MVSDRRDVEDEANRFASEFLMPVESIKSFYIDWMPLNSMV